MRYLYEEVRVPELLQIRDRHDDIHQNFNWGENILKKSTTAYIYNNELMNSFLLMLQKPVSILIDHNNIIRNFKNYMVDKYFYKHTN